MTFEPLYIQAKNRTLGNFQQNDIETFNWCYKNLGIKSLIDTKVEEVNLINIKEIIHFLPKREWFIKENYMNSIHGYLHTSRVIILLQILCNIYHYDNKKVLLISAAIHDVKRVNDKRDRNHGLRAGEWFKKKFYKHFKYLKNDEVDIITNIVTYHETEYDKIPNLFLKRYYKEIVLLKVADALDRYRLPKKKWWPKIEYFKFDIPKNIFVLSKLLIYYSEREKLVNNKDNYNSIIKALKIIVNKHGKN